MSLSPLPSRCLPLPLPSLAARPPANQRCFLSSNLASSAEHSSLIVSSSFRKRFRFFFSVFFISSSEDWSSSSSWESEPESLP